MRFMFPDYAEYAYKKSYACHEAVLSQLKTTCIAGFCCPQRHALWINHWSHSCQWGGDSNSWCRCAPAFDAQHPRNVRSRWREAFLPAFQSLFPRVLSSWFENYSGHVGLLKLVRSYSGNLRKNYVMGWNSGCNKHRTLLELCKLMIWFEPGSCFITWVIDAYGPWTFGLCTI